MFSRLIVNLEPSTAHERDEDAISVGSILNHLRHMDGSVIHIHP